MPVGTVRGRYELDAPALRVLRDLERQGIRTQEQMDRLGREMDRLGDQQDRQRLRDYAREMGDFRRGVIDDMERVQREWVATTQVVRREADRQGRAIDVLAAKMDMLGAKRVSPQIDVDGITAAIAQVEVLHSRINSLGRASATPRVGGGGIGGGGGGGGFRGGGGQGGLVRSIDFGPLSVSPRALMLGAGLLLPTVVRGGGAAGAIIGSAGSGLLGAGALGMVGAAGLAGGVGLGILGGRAAQGQITEAHEAMAKFRDVVADYGRTSKEAARAKRELDQAMAAAPEGTRELMRMTDAIRARWTRESRPAARNYVSMLAGGIRTGNELLGTAARGSERVTGALAREGNAFGSWLGGGMGQRGIRMGAGIFDENLGSVRVGTQYGMEAFLNVVQAGRPFFRESMEWLERWTRGWATGTRDISETRRSIERMFDQLRSWGRLAGRTGGLLGALLGTGAPEGQRAVDDLSAQFRRWELWIERHPEEVREFFARSVDSAKQLASAVWEIVEALGRLGDDLGPLLDRFSALVDLVGSLGLMTPGVGTLAYGAYRGARGGASGRGGGGAGGVGAAAGAGAIAGRGFGRGAVPGMYGRGIRGGMAGIAGTYGTARSFGYGRLSSAAAGLGATNLAGLGAGALGGAARAYLPVAGIMGALDFLAYEGGIGGRLQNAASGATLGLINRPLTAGQLDDRASAYAQDEIGKLSRGSSLAGLRGDIRRLEEAGWGVRGVRGDDSADFGSGAERSRRIRDVQTAFREEIAVRKQMARDLRSQRAEEARSRGARIGGELQEGYERRVRRPGGPNAEAEFGRTIRETRQQLAKMGPHGARGLATAQLEWAREMARGNDRLKDEVGDLERSIINRFDGMARRIATINGRIYVGTEKEWGRIRSAIASAARRGVDEASEEWQRLRSVAIGALRDMGYSEREARALFRAQSGGRRGQQRAENITSIGPERARQSGRLGGRIGPNSIDRASGARGPMGDGIGDGLGDRTGGRYAHRVRAAGAMSGGSLMGANPGLGKYANEAASYGLRVSSGLRPGSVTSYGNRSYHASGNALDLAGPPDAMKRFALDMARKYGSQLEELIHSPLGWSIKNGQRTAAYAVADHYDHVHIADTAPGAGGGGIRVPGGVNAGASVNLRARRSRLGGVPGALSTAAGDAYARGLEATINRNLGRGGGAAFSATGSIAEAVRAAGLPPIFEAIIMAESGGDPGAMNASGATGWTQIMWPLHRGIVPGATSRNALKNPDINLAAAKVLYEQSGLAPWAASRHAWGSKLQGDGIGVRATGGAARRRLSVGVRNIGGVAVSFAGANFNVRSEKDIDRIAETVGKKILAALNGDQVSEEAING
ncbi:MAG TPA: transglycosylase SLT domain-containing protein [Longimicrobiales bacterium]